MKKNFFPIFIGVGIVAGAFLIGHIQSPKTQACSDTIATQIKSKVNKGDYFPIEHAAHLTYSIYNDQCVGMIMWKELMAPSGPITFGVLYDGKKDELINFTFAIAGATSAEQTVNCRSENKCLNPEDFALKAKGVIIEPNESILDVQRREDGRLKDIN